MELLAVNYHYIDDENKYRTGIHPVSPRRLSRQIDLLKEKYTFISGPQFVSAIKGEEELPEKSCVLTFDDSLKSQYTNALPVLEEKEIPAVFFVLTRHIEEGRAYTLHKIHYLLSEVRAGELLEDVLNVNRNMTGKEIVWKDALDVGKIMSWYRYDDEANAKFKFLLNHYFSDEIAEEVTNILFEKHAQGSEKDFCDHLYMSRDDMRKLKDHPLASIQSHTHSHINIEKNGASKVENDIMNNCSVLKNEVGIRHIDGISYPFGKITKELFEEKIENVARKLKFVFGFSIEKKLNTDLRTPFLLNRFNSNDVPGGKNPLITL